MLFSSLLFLFAFLPVAWLLCGLAPSPFLRNCILLGLSVAFYMWGEGHLVLLLLGSSSLDYLCALLVARYRTRGRGAAARAALTLSIVGNVSVLAVFKYGRLLGLHSVSPGIAEALPSALPLGISFYTFQSMSYTIDVYRGRVAPTRNWINLLSFVSMFPQLVAGPIVRYTTVAGSLLRLDRSPIRTAWGIDRFIIGLGKKALIANTMAIAADDIFARPMDELSAPVAWLGVLAYSLQIYFDFSGYSDMAIGLGAMVGFRFPENFNRPYASRSIREFWRRWHITLSSWFRDYVYIPLGGSRQGQLSTMRNLVIVFALCGIWHGAEWQFLLWGLFHGFFLVLERTRLGAFLEALPALVAQSYALLVVGMGWVLFRAENLTHAGSFYGKLVGIGETNFPTQLQMYLQPDLLIALAAGLAFSLFRGFGRSRSVLRDHQLIRACCLAAIFALSVSAIATGTSNPFIYFRF